MHTSICRPSALIATDPINNISANIGLVILVKGCKASEREWGMKSYIDNLIDQICEICINDLQK